MGWLYDGRYTHWSWPDDDVIYRGLDDTHQWSDKLPWSDWPRTDRLTDRMTIEPSSSSSRAHWHQCIAYYTARIDQSASLYISTNTIQEKSGNPATPFPYF